jgi:hypothetical protein
VDAFSLCVMPPYQDGAACTAPSRLQQAVPPVETA